MDKRIAFSIDYIKKNLNQELSLEKISNLCNMSKNYFSFLFKKECGINFTSYIKTERLEKAKQILINTFLSIKEISYEVGYKHFPNFCQDFRKYFGLTPTEYRDKKLENNPYKKPIVKFTNFILRITNISKDK